MEEILAKIHRPYRVYWGDEERHISQVPSGTGVRIVLAATENTPIIEPEKGVVADSLEFYDGHVYRIKVRKYMTKPSTKEFNFMAQWNRDIPMPFRVMVGKVLRQTKGMVLMDLHCEPMKTDVCMRCGKPLSHPVSRLYGLGPECGSHAYINPFETEEELNAALATVQKNLANIKWRGWIIKSAIEEGAEIDERY